MDVHDRVRRAQAGRDDHDAFRTKFKARNKKRGKETSNKPKDGAQRVKGEEGGEGRGELWVLVSRTRVGGCAYEDEHDVSMFCLRVDSSRCETTWPIRFDEPRANPGYILPGDASIIGRSL